MASTLLTGWTLGAALAVLAAPAPALAAAPLVSGAVDTTGPVATIGVVVTTPDAAQNRDRDWDRGRDKAHSTNRDRDDAQQDRRRERTEDRRFDEEERISKSFKVGSSGSLLVSNVAGDIRVTGGSGSEIVVEATKHARGSRGGDASGQLRNVEVSIVESGGRVEVRTYHRGKNDRAWVDYVVTVPAQTRVDVQSVSGEIDVRGVKGETRAESVSGSVVGDGLGRVAQLKSVSGEVTLSNSQSDNELTLASISGDVRAGGLKARAVILSTVSGEAIVKGCECGRAQLKSVSGTLEYYGTIVSGGRYEANAHSGDIRFVPANGSSGYELEATTFSGDITAEPPVKVTSSRRGQGPGQSLRGTAGSGGAFLDLTTFSGDIYVGGGGARNGGR